MSILRIGAKPNVRRVIVLDTHTTTAGTNTVDNKAPISEGKLAYLTGFSCYLDGGTQAQISALIRDKHDKTTLFPFVDREDFKIESSSISWTGRFPIEKDDILRVDARNATADESLVIVWILEVG